VVSSGRRALNLQTFTLQNIAQPFFFSGHIQSKSIKAGQTFIILFQLSNKSSIFFLVNSTPLDFCQPWSRFPGIAHSSSSCESFPPSINLGLPFVSGIPARTDPEERDGRGGGSDNCTRMDRATDGDGRRRVSNAKQGHHDTPGQ
jgi:hypothetical protein